GSFPGEFGGSLERRQRQPTGLGDVALGRGPLHDQLAGKESETGQVALGMGKDRQVPVEVDDLLAFGSAGQVAIDLHAACRKNRKLDLRHTPLLSRTSA